MNRAKIQSAVMQIFRDRFEIENPDLEVDLREAYEFDSIDAIELLREIEILLDSELTRPEKKSAMEIRTLSQIIDYIQDLAHSRKSGDTGNGS